MLHNPVVLALLGTGFTFLATAVGAAFVFFVRKDTSPNLQKGFMGFAAGVMIAAARLPVAGNVYILSQYFGVAAHRVSAAILISTAASIATVPVVIHWITKG